MLGNPIAIDGIRIPAGTVDIGIRTHAPLPELPAELGTPEVKLGRLDDGQSVAIVSAGQYRVAVRGKTTSDGHDYKVEYLDFPSSSDTDIPIAGKDHLYSLTRWSTQVWLREVEAMERIYEEAFQVCSESVCARICTDKPEPDPELAAAIGLSDLSPRHGVETVADLNLSYGSSHDLSDFGFKLPQGYTTATIAHDFVEPNATVELTADIEVSPQQLEIFKRQEPAYQDAAKQIYGPRTQMRSHAITPNVMTIAIEIPVTDKTPTAEICREIYVAKAALGADAVSGKIWENLNSQFALNAQVARRISAPNFDEEIGEQLRQREHLSRRRDLHPNLG